ncbi:MAG: GHKL domain-containing protein [Lachnospiraceae bacterium]|nr:GHKL domain-containing protein [Lachnospiraceae bacterium]
MNQWVFILNNVVVCIFGGILSAVFCNTLNTRKNRWIFCGYIATLLLLQGGLYWIGEAEFLRRIYPLIMHLPLILILYFQTKKLLWSAIAVLFAYLCCQLRRYFALLIVAVISGGVMEQSVIELVLTLPLLLFLLRFVSPIVSDLTKHPVKMQWQFGIIPAMYYVFDYITVVYTDLLSSGAPVVIEFMPFVCCAAYLVFLSYNAIEERKRSRLQQVQKSLEIQLGQSVREIHALQESQALAKRYRHDLRHHLQYLSNCIENEQSEQAQAYIAGICREIEAQKVQQYCENEVGNLVLSAFMGRAKKEGIALKVRGMLPALIKLSDSDLCVLLSNALENAINACKPLVLTGRDCTIDVQFYMRESKFFLQIMNPCEGEVRFEKGIPVSGREGHGIGVQSICAIVQQYGGICSFLVQDGQFILRLSL